MKEYGRRVFGENRRLVLLLGAEAALGLLFVLTGGGDGAVLSFPYAPVGELLRRLSLLSAAGDAAAWGLYVLLSLSPVGVWLWLRRQGRRAAGDGMLWVLSAMLFLLLYWMVNPGVLASDLGVTLSDLGRASLQMAAALTFDSFLVLYLVLRFLRRAEAAGREGLNRSLRLALAFVATTAVFLLFTAEATDLRAALIPGAAETADLLPGSVYSSGETATVVTALVRFAVNAMALLADAAAALLGISLLRSLERERYGEESVVMAGALAAFCRGALLAVLGTLAGYNLLSLLLMGSVRDSRFTAAVPVFSVAFVLLLLLLAGALADRRALRQENDLFI